MGGSILHLFASIIIYAIFAIYGLKYIKSGSKINVKGMLSLMEIVFGIALMLLGLAFPVHAFLDLLRLGGIEL